ncbi:MAG: DUF1036 domain-containing protein [Hyphomicrobiaceae bacterium]
MTIFAILRPAFLACPLVGLISGVLALPAQAELKLCNATSSRVGVAIGYQDQRGWATEGWWNIGAQTCESVLKGPTPSRYIYVYAIDYERGGAWAGTHAMCISDSTFSIREVENCEGRGYGTGKFHEVDTGSANSWTVRFSDADEVTAEPN